MLNMAVPFGVRLRDPWRRFGLMLGLYALIYLLGSMSTPAVSLTALSVGYVEEYGDLMFNEYRK